MALRRGGRCASHAILLEPPVGERSKWKRARGEALFRLVNEAWRRLQAA